MLSASTGRTMLSASTGRKESAHGSDAVSATRKEGARLRSTSNLDIIRRFTWEISSINMYLEELRQFWARTLGISGPQWLILMAISDLDKDDGIPVNVVPKLLHVDPSFVTPQSTRRPPPPSPSCSRRRPCCAVARRRPTQGCPGCPVGGRRRSTLRAS